MNALNMARTAYASATAPIKTPQGVEYEAFARITSRMKAAAQKGNVAFPELAAALHDNRRLWLILAADVANTENPLPAVLRAQIFYLAEFTDLHTAKILSGAAQVDALIEVNSNIMRGLRQQERAK